MSHSNTTLIFPVSTLSLAIALSAAMVWRTSDMMFVLVFTGLVLPGAWFLLERFHAAHGRETPAQDRNRIVRRSVGLASLMIASAQVLSLLSDIRPDWISISLEERATGLLFAVILMAIGNIMPKTPVPLSEDGQASSRRQAQMRMSGLMMLLTGILYGGVWIFAPLAQAGLISKIVLISGMVLMMALMIGRAIRTR